MNRRRLLTAVLFCPASAVCLLAQHGKAKGKRNASQGSQPGPYFRREDYAAVLRYYNGPRDLPPGLRKKYYRTGQLPPGWQKKMQPFPPELVRALPPLPPDWEPGYIDGVAVVYDRRTRIILDTIDLIGAIAGR